MFLFNATLIAENDISEAVHTYLTTQLTAIADDRFAPSLLEMLDSPHDGVTYCIQLRAGDRGEILSFQQTHLAAIRQHLETVYTGKILFFESMMKYLN